MRLFFRNIPANTNPKELTGYIQPSLDSGFFNLFKRSGKITRIDILAQIDPESKVIRHHGLVTIKPDNAAKRTMERLNKTPFHGKSIFILEYINRSRHKNRRKDSSETMGLKSDRRAAERRIHILEKVTNFGIPFSDRSQYSRKRGH